HGAKVDVITGFRNKDLIILEDEINACADRHIVMTDDGSNGNKGVVTAPLKEWIDEGADYDLVLAVGPIIMMKFVAALTKEHGIRTLVSLNPLMIDGTGMCGVCRVKVGDEYLHACVDGPDFDGHLVDYDDALRRGVMYQGYEGRAKKNMEKRLVSEGRDCDQAALRRKREQKVAKETPEQKLEDTEEAVRPAVFEFDPETEAELAELDPVSAAKIRKALVTKLVKKEANLAAAYATMTGAGQSVYGED
ncbi:MAG: hypothetical protein LUB61_02665, partial [Eggerthellaceae bacterium]|nr:hypothetical protein [Eggerthellaceae bacterium]